MATNVGNVTVTVTLNDSLRARVIDLLERARQEHYSEPEGLKSCPARSYEKVEGQWKYVDRPERCDCGASELNAEIDAMISELRTKPMDCYLPGNQDRFGNEQL